MVEDQDTIEDYSLSVSIRDSNIFTIPYKILTDIFNEASNISKIKSNIVKSPGCANTFFVADTKNQPRTVVRNSTNDITCENICFRYNSYNICEHTIAVAEDQCILKNYLCKYR